ncbi:MAG: GNAT family N-acetyltransferase, partial [Veillonella sp.]|nr:GNAT family N-acetyltransferase [Veillonella sp.]
SKEWIENYPVYGLYIDGQLVSSITFCMPWVKYSTPDKYPHIAHFVTAPAFKGKGYAREVLGYAEELLKEQFKTHIVTLGTAKEHPWLPKMYESFGFTAYDKVHLTIQYIIYTYNVSLWLYVLWMICRKDVSIC